MVRAIQSLQSRLSVSETYTASSRVVGVGRRQASSVVPDNQVQPPAFLLCLDHDEPGRSLRFDAVADRVLDQGLKNERGNKCFHEFIRNVLFHSEPFGKTLLLNP